MKIIIFDDHCSMCSKEISYYRSIAKKNQFLWCDLHVQSHLLEHYNISRKEALMALHAIDEKGKLYKGIDAFIIIWQQLSYWKVLAFIIKLPIINPVAKFLYSKFAAWRYDRLDYCEID